MTNKNLYYREPADTKHPAGSLHILSEVKRVGDAEYIHEDTVKEMVKAETEKFSARLESIVTELTDLDRRFGEALKKARGSYARD